MPIPLRAKAPAPLVRPIDEDPEYRDALALLAALREQLRNCQAVVELSLYEQYSDEQLDESGGVPRLRLAALRKQCRAAKADAGGALETAKKLLLGHRRAASGVGDAVAEARLDIVLLGDAIGKQSAVVDEIRSRLSFQASLDLVAEHAVRAANIWRAALALIAARDREVEIYAALTEAGYQLRQDVLAPVSLGGAFALGRLADYDSQISHLKRDLEARGVI